MVLRSTTMLLVGSRTGSLQDVRCKGKSCEINSNFSQYLNRRAQVVLFL